MSGLPDSSRVSRPIPFWYRPLEIHISGYKNKGLAAFSVNGAVGCSHGCTFCSSPAVTFVKQKTALAAYGVADPAREWGQYAIPRYWDENVFRSSLRRAIQTPNDKLVPDGHRAVQYSTTVDPFMVFRDPVLSLRRQKQAIFEEGFVKSMEMIRDESDLKVRILTRSPLAKKHFTLMKSFGDRLLFGMSIPSHRDDMVRPYEPYAPGVQQRIKTLQAAADYGLHVFVAAAPIPPLLTDKDFAEFVTMTKSLNPVTVFAEPINLRGVNVEMMRKSFETYGRAFPSEPFSNPAQWADYAVGTMRDFAEVAVDMGLGDQLKLWPDEALLKSNAANQLIKEGFFRDEEELLSWVEQWHECPTAWPSSQN